MLRVVITSVLLYFISQSISVGKISLLPRKKEMVFYNFLAIFCLYSFFNIFLWQYQINFLIVITFVFILSLTMYYVHEFRGTNVNFSDILSLNTAKEVAGGYTYNIKFIFVVAFLIIVLEYVLQIVIFKIDIKSNYHLSDNYNLDMYRLFWHEIFQVFCFFISFFILKDKISQSDYDYSLNAGENEGYIYNFVSSIPIFHREKVSIDEIHSVVLEFVKNAFGVAKENVNNKYTKNTQDYVTLSNSRYNNYVRVNIDAPHIIVIMNESFGSVHRRIETNIPVTPYYDSLTGVTKGNVYVNTFGGGTANTEFEFLTGMTIGNYPYPVMPYNNFVKTNKYSLARYFKIFGYKTIAMHPYTATNYHRDKVYKRFGFDELLFFNDFKIKSYVRKFVSDKSMYEEVIRRFRVNRVVFY